MAKTAPSTITLKGDPQGREGLCTDAVITPGMLLAVSAQPAGVSSMGDSRILGVRPHNVESGSASAAFAREPDIFGGTIDTEYAVGDTVLYSEFRKGDMVYALLAAGNDVAVGALLESAGDGTLHVSQIFKWFAEDFTTADGGGLRQWLAGHAALLTDSPADRERVRRGNFRLDHLSYDWSLNGRVVR